MGRVINLSDYGKDTKGNNTKKFNSKKVKKIALTFKKDYKKLKKMLSSEEEGDFQHNKASVAMTKSMLKSVLAMIPLAEKAYHKKPGQSTAYSFTALVNIARELQDDIRNLVDLQKQTNHIVDNIINPNLMLVLQNMVNDVHGMRKDFRRKIVKPKSRLALKETSDDYLRQQGRYLDEIKNAISKQLHDYMVEQQ